MHIPSYFLEADGQRVADLIDRYGFATLLSPTRNGMEISHLPLMLDRVRGSQGVLVGHLARANPHSAALGTDATATALFHGPHGYVSPTWYEAPGVPTWNYAAVHVQGTVRVIEDPEEKWQIVRRLAAQYEPATADAWNPEARRDQWWKLLDAITGFEIEITHIDAKFKLSQNRISRDQENVIARLEASGHPDGGAMAQWMRENLERKRAGN